MKVSVICAADRPERLPCLYWSLVAQTHKDWEFIVLDQLESDFVDRNISIRDERLIPYDVKRMGDWGQSAKEEAAMNRATGDVLIFPADDAYYTPIALEHFVAGIEKGADITISAWVYDVVGYKPMPPAIKQGHIDIGGFAIRTSFFRKVGWPDKGQTGDFELVMSLIRAGAVVATDPSILYVKN